MEAADIGAEAISTRTVFEVKRSRLTAEGAEVLAEDIEETISAFLCANLCVLCG